MDAPSHNLTATRVFLDQVRSSLDEVDASAVEAVVDRLLEAWRARARVFVIGNGGSAATASHFVCDLFAATRGERALAVMCLSDSVPLLTALANDHGYENVFSDQVTSLAHPDDVLIALSASGSSENIVRALNAARGRGAYTVGIFGSGGGRAAALVEQAIVIRSTDFGVIESVHATLAHLLAFRVRSRATG